MYLRVRGWDWNKTITPFPFFLKNKLPVAKQSTEKHPKCKAYQLMYKKSERSCTLNCYSKFYKKVLSFVGFKTLGTNSRYCLAGSN